jgi:tetratricopeptide (TPR) repeat protein
MNPLEHPDIFHLQSAVGWIELGVHTEAHLELDQIHPSQQQNPDVLSVRWQALAAEKKWEAALEIASKYLETCPGRVDAWIHKAYAARRVNDGSIIKAKTILLAAANLFPEEPLIKYNLACYACQLDELEEARLHLRKAFEMDKTTSIKQMAMKDSDLKALWCEILVM